MIIVSAEVWCDAHQYDMDRCTNKFRTGLQLNSPFTSLRKAAQEEGWYRVPGSPNYYPRYLCPDCRAVQRQSKRLAKGGTEL